MYIDDTHRRKEKVRESRNRILWTKPTTGRTYGRDKRSYLDRWRSTSEGVLYEGGETQCDTHCVDRSRGSELLSCPSLIMKLET